MRSHVAEYLAYVLAAALAATLVVTVYLQTRDTDHVVRIPRFDTVSDYPDYGFKQVCRYTGNRSDFEPDGSDIQIGDRLVADCRIVAR